MRVAITNIQPNPISVLSGGVVLVSVTAVALDPVPKARLVFTNKQPAAAELFDSNERSDQIRSNQKDLQDAVNFVTHQIGFELQQAQSVGGAIIGVGIHFEDQNRNSISPESIVLATIGATAG